MPLTVSGKERNNMFLRVFQFLIYLNIDCWKFTTIIIINLSIFIVYFVATYVSRYIATKYTFIKETIFWADFVLYFKLKEKLDLNLNDTNTIKLKKYIPTAILL